MLKISLLLFRRRFFCILELNYTLALYVVYLMVNVIIQYRLVRICLFVDRFNSESLFSTFANIVPSRYANSSKNSGGVLMKWFASHSPLSFSPFTIQNSTTNGWLGPTVWPTARTWYNIPQFFCIPCQARLASYKFVLLPLAAMHYFLHL